MFKKLIISALLVLMCCTTSYAYRDIHSDYIRNTAGAVVASATVKVYLAGTSTVANIYEAPADTIPVASVTTGTDGLFTFYVDRFDYDSDQKFKIVATKDAATTTYDNVTINRAIVQTYTISADKTVSTNLKIPKGVIYSVASTKTLTLTGDIESGLYQVFTGSGTVSFSGGKVQKVYPEWWGLIADGSTDSTTSLASAVTAAAGKSLVLPPGSIVVGGASFTGFSLSANTKIIGAGLDVTTITLSASSSTTHEAIFKLADDCILSGFTINGNKTNQISGGNTGYQNGIYATGKDNITIENVRATSCEYSGMYLANGSNIRVQNSQADANGLNGIWITASVAQSNIYVKDNLTYSNGAMTAAGDGSGINIQGTSATDVYISYIKINGNTSYGNNRHGIVVIAGRYIDVNGNVVYLNNTHTTAAYGILLSEECMYSSVNGNVAYNNITGIMIDTGSLGGNIYGYHNIVGNTCHSNTNHGIAVQGTPNVNILSNQSIVNVAKGIQITDASDQFMIASNYVSGQLNIGINVSCSTGTMDAGSIIDNHIVGNGTGDTNECGLRLAQSGTGTVSNIVVKNNVFDANNLNGFDTSGTITGLYMTGNEFINTVATSFNPSAGTTFTIEKDNRNYIPANTVCGAGFSLNHFGRSWIKLTSAGEVTSDAVTAITDGSYTGQILCIVNAGAQNIIFKNAANTILNGAGDITLGVNDTMIVIWGGADWVQMGATGNN
jgi:parallel beta-helix repeat protein